MNDDIGIGLNILISVFSQTTLSHFFRYQYEGEILKRKNNTGLI